MFNPDGLSAGGYYIEFSVSQSSYNSADIIIPYYDITVAKESPTPTAIDGRVFSHNWAFICPSSDYSSPVVANPTKQLRCLNPRLYVVTKQLLCVIAFIGNATRQVFCLNPFIRNATKQLLGANPFIGYH